MVEKNLLGLPVALAEFYRFILLLKLCFVAGVGKNEVMGKRKQFQEKKWLNAIYYPHASRMMKYLIFR